MNSAHLSSGLVVNVGVCISDTDGFVGVREGKAKTIAEVRDVGNHCVVSG